MMLPSAVGPVALDLGDGDHEWATGVRLGDDWLEWHGGHHHRCRLAGPPVVDGTRLLVPTVEHGQAVLRAIGPSDTWLVFPADCPAWEAHQRGLT